MSMRLSTFTPRMNEHVTHIIGMNEALINARLALINDMYMNVRSFMSEKHSMNEHAHSGVTIQP